MRLGLLTSWDPTDRNSWSGVPSHAMDALSEHYDVVPLGPVDSEVPRWAQRVGRGVQVLARSNPELSHSFALSAKFAKAFRPRLEAANVDAIVALAASTEIALLDIDVPYAYVSDTTFALMDGFYREFSRLFPPARWQGDYVERRAIRRATLAAFPSQWARDSAVSDYGCAEDRALVIPFGANVRPHRASPARRPPSRHGVRLLWIGKRWDDKGGPLVLDALTILRGLGVSATLTVCGVSLPELVENPHVEVIGYLDKNDAASWSAFEGLYERSDLFVFPTRFDTLACALSESAAFGLPCVVADVAGVSTNVVDGVTGRLMPPAATAGDYAREILSLLDDPARYLAWSETARRRYDELLNWPAWAATFAREFSARLSPSEQPHDAEQVSSAQRAASI